MSDTGIGWIALAIIIIAYLISSGWEDYLRRKYPEKDE